MAKKDAFSKQAEMVTMKGIINLGKSLRRAKNILADLERQNASGTFTLGALREMLLQDAEIARLERGINQLIRDHQVKCPCCSYEAPLSNYRLIYAGPLDNDVVIECGKSAGMGRRFGNKCRMLLDSNEWRGAKKILSYAFVPLEEIFTKSPRG